MIPNTGGGTIAGPCEPALVQLQDGRVLTVFRIDSFKSHWAALSSDGGKSWGEAFPTHTWSVSPNLIQMRNGAIVLTSGRPGIGLWITSVADLMSREPHAWTFYNVIKVSTLLG